MRTALLLLLLSTGCQCCSLTECYQDHVDTIADHEGHWDRLYCPGLDLTRIGRRDWCQYRINHWMCPCRCERPTMLPCGHNVVMAPATTTPRPSAPPAGPPPEPQPFSPPETDSLPIPTLPDPLPAPEAEPAPAPTVQPTAFEEPAANVLIPPDPEAKSESPLPAEENKAEELLPWTIKQSAATSPRTEKPVMKTRSGRIIAPRPDNSALPEWSRNLQ